MSKKVSSYHQFCIIHKLWKTAKEKEKKEKLEINRKKNVHNSFNFVFCPNLAINWQPLKRKIILAVQ